MLKNVAENITMLIPISQLHNSLFRDYLCYAVYDVSVEDRDRRLLLHVRTVEGRECIHKTLIENITHIGLKKKTEVSNYRDCITLTGVSGYYRPGQEYNLIFTGNEEIYRRIVHLVNTTRNRYKGR